MSIQARQGFAAVRGIVYGSAFVFLWAWVASAVRRYDASLPVSMPSALRALGFVLACVGGVIAASCIAVFASRGEGTPFPLDAPRKFVATGPYRYVRNPMYVGAILVLIGAGFAVLSPSIVLLGFAFWGLMHLLVLVYEEPVLTAKFGDDYTRYRKEVNRWLPRF
ncbi:MAG: isoprenylcysteine carboxylmethyltransferase family protein [Acidobacteriota bacterium]